MFTKLSSEQALNQKILIDNIFIVEYMPFAPENYVKVYLYGLSQASHNIEADNSLERVARRLNMETAAVMEAYSYWQEQGLVNILMTEPVSVEYLPVKRERPLRKFSKEKYKPFNDQLHAMLPSRIILPAEYNEYYSIMEAMHIDAEAMLAIIAYCVRLKGADISCAYILAVARNLAYDGYTSYEGVSEKLSEFELYSGDIAAVLKALGSRKTVDLNDKRLYAKWTKSLGFTADTIIKTAALLKKGGMEKLDGLLTSMYEKHAFSFSEISDYLSRRDKLFELAKEITRRIGVYYEQLDFFIETYVLKWQGYGYDGETLIYIAGICFSRSIRTVEGMDGLIAKFYRQGLLSKEAIDAGINLEKARDAKIKAVLAAAGNQRRVSDWDRDYYDTWTEGWHMPDDVILYAAKLAAGKGNVMSYVNNVLSDYNRRGVRLLSEAQKLAPPKKTNTVITAKSADELNKMLANINPEDI